MIHIRAKHLKKCTSMDWQSGERQLDFLRVTYIPRFPDQTPHSAKSDLDLDCLSISHGFIYSYFDLFIAQVVFVPRSYTYMY